MQCCGLLDRSKPGKGQMLPRRQICSNVSVIIRGDLGEVTTGFRREKLTFLSI